MAESYLHLGQYQEAITVYKEALEHDPKRLTIHIGLAAAYMMTGREAEAHAAAAEVLRIDPNFSLERYANSHPLKNRADLWNHCLEPFRKAGLK